MFQYVLALLLINTYYQSLGNPILPTAGNHSISQSLLALAKSCGNKFLSEQILNKTKDCDLTWPPYEDQQFQCLMFYDINMQLCSAVDASKLSRNENYSPKINEPQDVNTFCMSVKDLIFTNLTEFVKYKMLAQKRFSMPATCGIVCGYTDVANQDVNYYCKYYKWGLDMLKTQMSTTTSAIANNTTVALPKSDGSNADIAVPINSSNVQALLDTKTSNVQTQSGSEVHANDVQSTLEKGSQPSEANVLKIESGVQNKEQVPEINRSEDMDPNKSNLEDPTIQLPKEMSTSIEQSVIPAVKQPKLQIVDGNQAAETGNALLMNVEQKEPVIETPANKKPLDDNMEYPGSEEDKMDAQGDEDEETLGDINEHQQVKEKIPVEKNSYDTSQKEYFPHSETEEYTEDSDNFFPFFLTVVIMVVLLYILYHNKNKVSKMFFGLVLEGRQSSRRRNSRGHSYRRLDTLEQAMSANTAAPPSKIIY